MSWVGMCSLGIFVGYVVIYGLKRVADWGKPANVFTAVFSSATGGAIFIFIQYLSADKQAIFLYPIGLIYGTLCANLDWITQPNLTPGQWRLAVLQIVVTGLATLLLLMIFLCPWFRGLLAQIH